ncbi:MAG TPA: carboxypeptidase-like regulatory domain-containing protein [Desulfomonilaceae bacterium]|nr:carboxypeptidase-like regulatory domain-containing protein [Desulfomonilaceae bacterium]
MHPTNRSLTSSSHMTGRYASSATAGVLDHFLMIFPVLTVMTLLPDLCFAAPPVAGENGMGIFYTVTHLHPAAYFILFLIFALSVTNLIFQGWITHSTWPISSALRLINGLVHTEPSTGIKGLRRGGPRTAMKARPQTTPAPDDGIVGVRRILNTKDSVSQMHTPTPLEGINHPIPNFASTMGSQTGAPRILDSKPVSKSPHSDFRFSSAVDFPSPEEMERREKEQIVVAGAVKDLEGNGIPSVIVYLTDEEGNRTGQSCRTAQDTGEFRVLINEPGKYTLNGYKRGFIMESREPLVLPIESGKIEGFNFRMIPEGCLVQGRVLTEPGGKPVSGHLVKCSCGNGQFSRSAYSDAAGEFRISGILLNSKCFIDVYGENGEILARSTPFETVQKKEVYRELFLPDQSLVEEADAPETSGFEDKRPDHASV